MATMFVKCPNCKGRKVVTSGEQCIECRGTGYVSHEAAKMLRGATKYHQLDPAPPVPKGLRPRPGVEYGCGKTECRDCYEVIAHRPPWPLAR